MKKFENLGKILSKEDQKKLKGGDPPATNKCGDGCVIQVPPQCEAACYCGRLGDYYKCQYWN